MRVILASASPRRREILSMAGLSFTVSPTDCAELDKADTPDALVKLLSYEKARAGAEAETARSSGRTAVIGADTVVSCGGQVLGKPRDREDALRMLSLLQGREHQVYTGVTVFWRQGDGPWRWESFSERTRVWFFPMSPEEIEGYVSCGESMDKAGAYAIQGRGSVYIRGIEGDYYNVMGLPVARLYQFFRRMGWLEPEKGEAAPGFR